MNAITDPATHVPFWTRASAMCVRAIAAIGEPEALAARSGLTRKAKHDIAAWLARLESIVRKLLLALAAMLLENARKNGDMRAPGLQPRQAPPSRPHAPQGQFPSPRSTLDRAAPQTWPARFALAFPRDPRAMPEAHVPRIRALWGETPITSPAPAAPRAPHRVTDPALRFGLRLEALKRVLADPIPYAERLARVFTRLLRRYPEAAHRYAIMPARPHAFDEGDPRLIIDVLSLAMAAAYLLPNTS